MSEQSEETNIEITLEYILSSLIPFACKVAIPSFVKRDWTRSERTAARETLK
jgi:hypothetical protein